mgnify:CR=1 FL=1
MADQEFDDEVLEQQEQVRRSGAVNMFDKSGVQDVAEQMGFDELASFIDEADAEEYIEMAGQSAKEGRQ